MHGQKTKHYTFSIPQNDYSTQAPCSKNQSYAWPKGSVIISIIPNNCIFFLWGISFYFNEPISLKSILKLWRGPLNRQEKSTL